MAPNGWYDGFNDDISDGLDEWQKAQFKARPEDVLPPLAAAGVALAALGALGVLIGLLALCVRRCCCAERGRVLLAPPPLPVPPPPGVTHIFTPAPAPYSVSPTAPSLQTPQPAPAPQVPGEYSGCNTPSRPADCPPAYDDQIPLLN